VELRESKFYHQTVIFDIFSPTFISTSNFFEIRLYILLGSTFSHTSGSLTKGFSTKILSYVISWSSRYGDRAIGWTIRGSIPGRGRGFLYSKKSKSALGHTQPSIHWVQGAIHWVQGAISVGVKRPGSEFDHTPPSGEKKGWSCTSAFTVWLHGTDRENFTVTLLYRRTEMLIIAVLIDWP
jgi:hypothetical protein